jgi:hypothetical protein
MRPDTPEAWPATERDRVAAIQKKQLGNNNGGGGGNHPSSADNHSSNAPSHNDENASHRSNNSHKEKASKADDSKLMPIQPKGSVPQARKPFGARQPNAPSSRYDQQSARPGYRGAAGNASKYGSAYAQYNANGRRIANAYVPPAGGGGRRQYR